MTTALKLASGRQEPLLAYIDVVWTSGGGVPTTGKFRLWVLYYVTGREDFSQG